MSDLQTPLFDEEKEFLERKKLEYERALRGDVEEIKEKSVKAGKVALVGAGLAGSVWLIAKAFGGLSKRKKNKRYAQTGDNRAEYEPDGFDDFDGEDDGFGSDADYFTAGNGKRYKSVVHYKSAADSARVFQSQGGASEHQPEYGQQSDDLGFGANAIPTSDDQSVGALFGANSLEESPFDPQDFQDDPFRDLPYDDSRRLPTSHDFDGDELALSSSQKHISPRSSNMVGQVLQAFLKSDTGKMLVAQAAAVALAMVTKKVSEFFPADKNPDLADSPAYAPAETGFAPVASLASPDSPDASTHTSAI
ncbi:hypothetical protein [Hymenobacter arizonensis]|uniref:Uncharacterized protein n=1 Tax=Hymenobacter arizonensis TaxID=1227077 RepID=A0A1I5XIR4_HYMAR|nr:hypothetical protein [Hymenobacter arizonensis]SFQ31852.1 hypothetical protein SAMN04515668_1881 [Hymenobacter arizonensis]